MICKQVCVLLISLLATGCAITQKGGIESRIYPGPSEAPIKDLEFINSVLPKERSDTLVVFDIDDTLLTSETFFGSDYWYEWQNQVAKQSASGGHSSDYVPCTFDVVALSYEAGTLSKTQADADKIFNSIQFDKLLITSRNPAYRGATERELTRAETGYVLPGQLSESADGIIFTSRSDKRREVSYHNGIFMISGQNKGLLLLELLEKLNLKYDSIVFIDDGEKHIKNMRDALQAEGVPYIGIHYTRIQKDLPDIQVNKLKEARKAWSEMSSFWKNVFPGRYQEIERQKQCNYGSLIKGKLAAVP